MEKFNDYWPILTKWIRVSTLKERKLHNLRELLGMKPASLVIRTDRIRQFRHVEHRHDTG